MTHVVLVTDIPFWQNSIGSHMRIQGLARFLAGHGRLTVFFLKSLNGPMARDFAALGLPGARLVSYKGWSGRKLDFNKDLGKLAFFRKWAADDFCSSLRAFLQEHPADAVVLEYIRLGYLLDGCPRGTLTLLDMHDVMSERSISLRRAGLQASIEMDAATEIRILGRFDRVLTISRADDAHLSGAMGLKNALYVPCSVALPEARHRIGDGRRLVFVGARTAPNIEGLRWFLDQVWPLLLPEGFTLDVVGTVGDAFPEAPPGVTRHGQNDDLHRFLAEADIAINPVFVGGGLKIKCIDALAAGLPCVTTAEGAAGLDRGLHAGLVVAATRLDFVAAIRHFARNPAERRIVADLGPRFIAGEFSDASAYRRLAAWLDMAIRARLALPAPGPDAAADAAEGGA